MVKRSKTYKKLAEKAPEEPIALGAAIDVLKQFEGAAKFDQAVEVHMRLGIDPKQADQLVRGSIVLPNGIGKAQRVVVFAKGPAAEAAKEAGADEVGQEDLAKRIGFRIAPGFSERVIFREMFLNGLTLLDLKGGALSLSHVAARQEVRELLKELNLPGVAAVA